MLHEGVDHALSALAWLMQRRVRTLANTHARMAYYEGLPRTELYPEPSSASTPRVGRTFKVLGVECQNLVFDSLHVPLHPDEVERYFQYQPLHRFFVRRVRREGPAPRRALVYLHAWMIAGANAPDSSFAALLSRQLDCDVYNVQQVHHGRRQIPGSNYHGVHFFTADVAMTFESVRQAVIDARTVVRHLLASGQYDEVGIVGVSMGGALGTMVACFEPELSFALPIVSHIDIADALRHALVVAHARRKLREFGVSLDEFSRLNDVLSKSWLKPAIEPERIMLLPGTHDTCMRPEVVRAQLVRWPGVHVRWLEGGHFTAMLRLGQALPEVRAFIDGLPRHRRRFGQTMPPEHAPT